jgi:putative membrane protein
VHEASAEPRDSGESAQADYRYLLANERTFLAWIRTALAVLAAGIAAREIALPFALPHGRGLLSDLCLGLAVALVALAYQRWRAVQQAMAEGRPLPAAGLVRLLAAGMLGIAVLATSLVVLR